MIGGPPRLARAWLRRTLSAPHDIDVLDDLEALWRERRSQDGRWRAGLWYWKQTLQAVLAARRDARSGSVGTGTNGRGGTMESMRRDAEYAFKQLKRHPAVGIVVVLTLALGIGATTAIFSAVHGVLLTPLPFDEPEELVMVTATAGNDGVVRYLSGPDFVDLGEQVEVFDDVAMLLEATVGPMTEVDRPEHVLTAPVSWNLFHMLGVEMALGRNFAPEDATLVPEGQTRIWSGIISHDFWQRSFAGDPDVIGRTVHIWGGPTVIVGVLPEGFGMDLPPALNVPAKGDIWRAVRSDMSLWSRDARTVRTIGRLAPGATTGRAAQALDQFGADIRRVHPIHAAEDIRFHATSVERAVAAPMSGPLWVLMGAVTLVLLIACANVANLLLARGAARASEMAVRSSLGADSGRLVRQLLTESAVLAVLGAGGGVLLAVWGVDLLHAIRPTDLPRLEQVRLDWPVLVFTVGVAMAATLLAGLLPAWQTARAGVAQHLKRRGGTEPGRRSRTTLVVAEVALSLVLLVGAGLLIRTFSELQRMPLGFEPEQVLTVTATQSPRTPEERQAYEADLIRSLEDVPGVSAAGIVFPLPMNGVYDRSAEYAMDGREADPSSWTTAYFRTVSPTYFDAMGLQLRAGRAFETVDENRDVPVVILDERLAEREFGSADPVGKPLWVRGMGSDTLRAEVLGVVEYAPQWDHRDTRPTMYFPRAFYLSHEVSVVARVEGDPAAVAPAVSRAIAAVDRNFPADLVPMETFVRERLARSRFLLVLMQTFGGLALGLSAVGLYGVLSYSVRQRTRELGLRLALGAEGPELTRRVVLGGLKLAATGIGVGVFGALLLGRALRSQLFGVSATDPWTFSGAAVVVLLVAATASLLPALRAARVDPVVALQEE